MNASRSMAQMPPVNSHSSCDASAVAAGMHLLRRIAATEANGAVAALS
jgi:hypothetical protein